ncbi:NAD(P)-dependent oxidoreductase [Hydrogenophaga sp. PBL-H3]|uniref:NAD(P)-dependent oxidoreductase n=1 Tax=Hydrogenophaga sp. PBL-H3 TaxID=434010 RepID=UPI00131FBA05|nr:NAD(P)-dependent oxidoreductase [Hydrogenophaga sp. PBL-H3]QHE77738.1 3-phosphoglycerate dehydrogenase [Hydrogenophaga sp. PBL-H3]QHE82162.1 3-phosphoglycerate dehydrogenase [Hydrogenophaga sp. PBL-H3]
MSARPVILVTGADLAPQALDLLKDHEVVFAGKTPQLADVAALARQHNPVGIIVRYSGVNAEVMDAAPALRVVSKHGSGTDTIDKVAAAERGIAVTAAVGANAAAVAEQAMALLLACAKSVVQLNQRMHDGHWDKATHKSLELGGRTVGLVGLGAIGLRFAKMAHAMDMRVIGFDPFAKNLPDYVTAVDLDTLWREADAISLHCPLTPENKGLLSAQTLARCKPGVIVVNTARGGLIDEPALLAAVQSGHVGMAGLDSFCIEPMTSPHIFHHQPGFILSPHIGGVTGDAYVNMGVAAARNALTALTQPELAVASLNTRSSSS